MKGAQTGSWWETRLEYEIPRNRGRKYRKNAKGQVGVQRSIKRYISNGQHTRTSGPVLVVTPCSGLHSCRQMSNELLALTRQRQYL
jgi:hypothetical protein